MNLAHFDITAGIPIFSTGEKEEVQGILSGKKTLSAALFLIQGLLREQVIARLTIPSKFLLAKCDECLPWIQYE